MAVGEPLTKVEDQAREPDSSLVGGSQPGSGRPAACGRHPCSQRPHPAGQGRKTGSREEPLREHRLPPTPVPHPPASLTGPHFPPAAVPSPRAAAQLLLSADGTQSETQIGRP